MNNKTKQITNMTSFEYNTGYNYGHFVTLSDQNEIICYSRNGNAIYYAEEHPITPIKQKRNMQQPPTTDYEVISKYNQYSTSHYQGNQYAIEVLHGVLGVLLFIITITSFYILFFDDSY